MTRALRVIAVSTISLAFLMVGCSEAPRQIPKTPAPIQKNDTDTHDDTNSGVAVDQIAPPSPDVKIPEGPALPDTNHGGGAPGSGHTGTKPVNKPVKKRAKKTGRKKTTSPPKKTDPAMKMSQIKQFDLIFMSKDQAALSGKIKSKFNWSVAVEKSTLKARFLIDNRGVVHSPDGKSVVLKSGTVTCRFYIDVPLETVTWNGRSYLGFRNVWQTNKPNKNPHGDEQFFANLRDNKVDHSPNMKCDLVQSASKDVGSVRYVWSNQFNSDIKAVFQIVHVR